MVESLVLTNGHILTLSERDIPRGALRIADGKIIQIIEGELPRKNLSLDRMIDLKGKTVLPGFIDSHVHVIFTGLSLNSVDLSDAKSIDNVLEIVRGRVLKTERGEWVFGTNLTYRNLKEKRNPTMDEIDRISEENPIWLISDTCHSSVTNSIGFQKIGLPEDAPGVEKDPITQKPTGGFVTDPAHFGVSRRILASLKKEIIQDMIKIVSHTAATRGVTTLHAMDGSPDSDRNFLILLETIPKMPIKIVPYFQTMDVDRVLELGLPRIGGCLTLDGAWSEHTVALKEPYNDMPESYGMLFYTDQQIEGFVQRAHEAGLQIAMHAVGDRAIDQLLNSYEKTLEKIPRIDHRHRIEHFSLPMPHHIQRAKSLGLVVSMQPMFSYNWGGPEGVYVQYLGKDRARRIENYRFLLDKGIKVCGGSDSPVTPIDPIRGIHAAVNNPFFDHRVSTEEALLMFTYNGAWATHEENLKGSIEVGKSADLVVLTENPKTLTSENLLRNEVAMTLVDGKIVYKA